MALVFKNCCCCINLRTGSLLIGYLNLIGLISLFFTLAVKLRYYFRSWLTGTLVVLDLILIVIHLIFTFMLLYSIHKNVHKYIPRYIFYNATILVLNIAFFVVNLFVYHYSTTDIVTEVISFLVTIYFLLIIRSYYLTVKLTAATNSHPTAVYNRPTPVNTQPPAQQVYLAPGNITNPGVFVMPSGYPHPGSQSTHMTYPIQGGYPGQGGYSGQGAYPGQGVYPNHGAYPGQGAYPIQGGYPGQGHSNPPPYPTAENYQTPGTYPDSGSISTRAAPSAPMETEKTGFY